jgi:hypothetical protein
MKFNVEVEIDYLDDNSIDGEFAARLENSVVEKVSQQLSGELATNIANKANSLVTAKVELLINTILEQPITVTKGWNDVTKYASTFDMVETRMSQLYGERLDVNSGKCMKDPYLSVLEKYIDDHIKKLMTAVEKQIKEEGAKIARKSLNDHELMQAIGATVQLKRKANRTSEEVFIKPE